ncbi:hypothetical protein LEN26_000960 [Aphanomyces euteiches]|nr:hypothetical protein AeMF1_003873 [Aphanomyces euteiches]KAH9162390.1 hypothetical protein LEN26_000960 [Aphanomyces euteiches]KAH9164705.1 hypothetical protein AeNC1_018649 [Aphanomyces euteiches]
MKSTISKIKKLAIEQICGTIVEGYRKLHDYFIRLGHDNPGSYSVFETWSDGTFRRCFFIPGCFHNCASKVKPLMSLDGTHLKGIYNKSGVFLAGSMKDGSGSNLLVALAIEPAENEENWVWFMKHIRASCLQLPPDFFFISDRCKGLQNAVKTVSPHAWQRYCMFHIVLNIRDKKIKVSDDHRKLIYQAADAQTEEKSKAAMRQLERDLPRAYKYLSNIKPGQKSWASWAINDEGFATHGAKTANGSEQNHSWLGILLRSSNPVSVYFQYMTKLQAKFKKRLHEADCRSPLGLVVKAQIEVEHSVKWSRQYIASQATLDMKDPCLGKYTVRHGNSSKFTGDNWGQLGTTGDD